MYAGPAGAWAVQWLSIDEELKGAIVDVLKLLGLLMQKSSTPGMRQKLRIDLPRAVTKLEIFLPMYIDTMVTHVLVYHAVDILEATGPFHVSNMLDIERSLFFCLLNCLGYV